MPKAETKEQVDIINQSDISKEKVFQEVTLSELALRYFYEGHSITRKNCNEVALKFGYKSGEKLFQHFSKYSSRQNRIAKEVTFKKSINKLKLFQKVVLSLSGTPKKNASDEINTLKAAIDKEYT
jgi:hypothetical protein